MKTNHPRQIALVGGPLNGSVHELRHGWPVPSALLLKKEDSDVTRHKYVVCEDETQAIYSDSIG